MPTRDSRLISITPGRFRAATTVSASASSPSITDSSVTGSLTVSPAAPAASTLQSTNSSNLANAGSTSAQIHARPSTSRVRRSARSRPRLCALTLASVISSSSSSGIASPPSLVAGLPSVAASASASLRCSRRRSASLRSPSRDQRESMPCTTVSAVSRPMLAMSALSSRPVE